MAKLYFRFGAMGSSKTANALMVAYNYEEKGLKPLFLKRACENRDGEKIAKSRIGISRECEFVEDFIFKSKKKTLDQIRGNYDCIIIDEVQFCKLYEIRMLPHIVNELNIPVICYGLKTDFLLRPFPAAAELLSFENVIEEIKKIQNEIAINPNTLDVPSFLEVIDWKKRSRTVLNYNTDISSIYSAFIRKEDKERPCIKYISSSNF